MRALLPVVDILLPNLTEAQKLAGSSDPGDCAQALLEAGARLVVLKLGREGCLVGSQEELVHLPGFRVRTRDTTGAGDYFAAGFVAGFLSAMSYPGAAVLANAMGAAAVARIGAGASVPGAQQVLDLLLGHPNGLTNAAPHSLVEEAVTYVRKLATRPAEEGRPWWK